MKLLSTVFFGLLFVVSLDAQTTALERQFIPEKNQAAFHQSLEKLIDCYKRHDWGCVYDISFQPRLKRIEFVEQKGNNFFFYLEKLSDFRAILTGRYVDPMKGSESWYPVEGCMKFVKGKNRMVTVNAFLVKGEWYFGDPSPYEMGRGIPDQPCKLEDYSAVTSK